jgi:pimeloyl-ACP methyl ester carboxylesterase
MMIQRQPDLFAAYVGASQAVSGPEGAKLGYELALKAARKRGDAVAVAALEQVGPPPYARFEDFLVRQTYTNPPGLPPTLQEAAAISAQAKALSAPPAPDAHYIARGLPPYDFMKVFMETQRATFTETFRWQARDYGFTFKVPIFVYQGDHDLNTPISLARAWFDQVRAPTKAFEVIPGAGHNTLAFSDQILALLDKEVRPLALGSATPRAAL